MHVAASMPASIKPSASNRHLFEGPDVSAIAAMGTNRTFMQVYSLFFTIPTIETSVPKFHCFLHPSNSKPYL
jgi:hypothetical protein